MLLCSDGLWEMLDDSSIAEVLDSVPTAEEAADRLLAGALHAGGRDNVTLIVLDWEPIA
jgi:protein phosphatase